MWFESDPMLSWLRGSPLKIYINSWPYDCHDLPIIVSLVDARFIQETMVDIVLHENLYVVSLKENHVNLKCVFLPPGHFIGWKHGLSEDKSRAPWRKTSCTPRNSNCTSSRVKQLAGRCQKKQLDLEVQKINRAGKWLLWLSQTQEWTCLQLPRYRLTISIHWESSCVFDAMNINI